MLASTRIRQGVAAVAALASVIMTAGRAPIRRDADEGQGPPE